MISEYYVYLIKHGMLRDPAMNKVIAHPFLYDVLRELMFKAQSPRDLDKWEGPCRTNKVFLAFGNRLTFLAALEVLGLDYDVVYNPGWGDQLVFELIEEGKDKFVKILINGDLVKRFSADGKIPFDQFIDFVCSKLYFGNMDKVKQGKEDYRQIAEITGGKCDSLTEVVPLFGCKKKQQSSTGQNINSSNQNGLSNTWGQSSASSSNRVPQYRNRLYYYDNSQYLIEDSQSDVNSYDQAPSQYQHRAMGTERYDIQSLIASQSNRYNPR